MKIPEVKRTTVQKSRTAKKASAPAGASFSDHLSNVLSPSSDTPASEEIAAIGGVGAIIAVQEVSDEPDQAARHHLVRHGEDILDNLDELRRDLLIGAIPKDRLANLTQTLRNRKSTITDPQLLQIIDEIELRAEVELAKWNRTS